MFFGLVSAYYSERQREYFLLRQFGLPHLQKYSILKKQIEKNFFLMKDKIQLTSWKKPNGGHTSNKPIDKNKPRLYLKNSKKTHQNKKVYYCLYNTLGFCSPAFSYGFLPRSEGGEREREGRKIDALLTKSISTLLRGKTVSDLQLLALPRSVVW